MYRIIVESGDVPFYGKLSNKERVEDSPSPAYYDHLFVSYASGYGRLSLGAGAFSSNLAIKTHQNKFSGLIDPLQFAC